MQNVNFQLDVVKLNLKKKFAKYNSQNINKLENRVIETQTLLNNSRYLIMQENNIVSNKIFVIGGILCNLPSLHKMNYKIYYKYYEKPTSI